MDAHDAVADVPADGHAVHCIKMQRSKSLAGPVDGLAGMGIHLVGQTKVQCSVVMVSSDDDATVVGNEVEALSGAGPITHDVAEADDVIDFKFSELLEDSEERMEVSMDI